MLGKLLKYEVKASARTYLPLYGTVLVLALINRLFVTFDVFGRQSAFPVELIAVLATMGYVFVICAIFVMTLIVTIQRFYKNLLGDEGYLMFTLPVKPWQHITAKMLATTLWFLVSLCVTFLSLLFLGADWELLREIPGGFVELLRLLNMELGAHWPLFTLESILLCLASLFSGILLLYASMALGHLLQKWRVLGAFGAFLALTFLQQMVTGFLSYLLGNTVMQAGLPDLFFGHPFASLHFSLLVMLVYFLLWSAVHFFLTNLILCRKLNLE